MSTWEKWPKGGPTNEALGVYNAWCSFTEAMGMDHAEPDDYCAVDKHSETFQFRWFVKEVRGKKRWAVLTVTAEWDADFDGERMVGKCAFHDAHIDEVWE